MKLDCLCQPDAIDNFLELGAMPQRVKAGILNQGEDLHVSLIASAIEPHAHLPGFSKRRISRSNVIGRHAFVIRRALEPAQNMPG